MYAKPFTKCLAHYNPQQILPISIIFSGLFLISPEIPIKKRYLQFSKKQPRNTQERPITSVQYMQGVYCTMTILMEQLE